MGIVNIQSLGFSLKLRANNTFEYNAGTFLFKEMYYGFYNIVNDTLILNFDGLNPENINNKLTINKDWVIEISDIQIIDMLLKHH